MQVRYFFAVAGLLCTMGHWSAARADTVMYDSVGFIEGSQSFVDTFNIATPGTLTISLTEVPWLDAISNLSFFLSSANGVFGTPMDAGSESMRVGPGTFYAHWFGQADGQFQLGVYALEIRFHPDVSAVPLPGSLTFMMSGVVLLLAGRRRGWSLRRAAA